MRGGEGGRARRDSVWSDAPALVKRVLRLTGCHSHVRQSLRCLLPLLCCLCRRVLRGHLRAHALAARRCAQRERVAPAAEPPRHHGMRWEGRRGGASAASWCAVGGEREAARAVPLPPLLSPLPRQVGNGCIGSKAGACSHTAHGDWLKVKQARRGKRGREEGGVNRRLAHWQGQACAEGDVNRRLEALAGSGAVPSSPCYLLPSPLAPAPRPRLHL